RNGVGLKDTFWRKQNPAALCFVVRQPNTVRQPRTRTVRDLGHRRGHLCSSRTNPPFGMCFGATKERDSAATIAPTTLHLNSSAASTASCCSGVLAFCLTKLRQKLTSRSACGGRLSK